MSRSVAVFCITHFASLPAMSSRLISMFSRRKIQVTIIYSIFYLWIGAIVAAPGPALLALARQTSSPLTQIGLVLSARAFAYLAGSLSGLVFERFDAHRLLAASLSVAVIGTVTIPACTSIYALSIAIGCQGLVCGFLDCGINTLIFIVHAGGRVEPYMQLLHASFGLGAFVSPLVIGGSLRATGGASVSTAFVVLGLLVVPFIALLALRFPSPSKTAASVKFYADSQQEIDHAIAQGDSAHENPAFSSLLAPEKLVVALATIMLFCDVGVEMSAAGFIPEFATQAARIKFSEVTAANLVAVYWAFFTLARFVAIAVSLRLSVTRQLGGTLIGLVASILLLNLFGSSSPAVLWFGVACLGFFVAPVFPTVLLCAEQYVKITPRVATIMIIGASSGEMLLPTLCATLVPRMPSVLWIITLIAAIGPLVCFVVMQRKGVLRLEASKTSELFQQIEHDVGITVDVGKPVIQTKSSKAATKTATSQAAASQSTQPVEIRDPNIDWEEYDRLYPKQ